MTLLRRTKIIATLGPAVDKDDMLQRTLKAGVNLVRINMSHGQKEDHQRRIEATRAYAKILGYEIGILIDLQGPKIRVSRFKNGSIELKAGQKFILDANCPTDAGDLERVSMDYKDLPKDVSPGDKLLLNDGLLMLEVKAVLGVEIHCVVLLGGILSNHKGINRMGGGLTAEALTEKDKEDIVFAAKMNADYVAVSFPRSAADIQKTRELLQLAGSKAGIVAKIERLEAVADIEDIIRASEAVMVARGDLGVELGYAELPAVQKHIIARARALDRAVITATQMMESMIHQPIPTRAEVSDVANAVLDGTDAVMLSAETASGDFPDKVVEAMASVCLAAERQRAARISGHRVECQFERVDEAIAMAAMYTANHFPVKAIVALTESGSTPLWMSRIRSGIPIFGLSRNILARGRMTLYRGVYPLDFDVTRFQNGSITKNVIQYLLDSKMVATGDRLIITKGDYLGNQGGANSMKIVVV